MKDYITAEQLRQLIKEYTALSEAYYEPPYDGSHSDLAVKYNELLRAAACVLPSDSSEVKIIDARRKSLICWMAGNIAGGIAGNPTVEPMCDGPRIANVSVHIAQMIAEEVYGD